MSSIPVSSTPQEFGALIAKTADDMAASVKEFAIQQLD